MYRLFRADFIFVSSVSPSPPSRSLGRRGPAPAVLDVPDAERRKMSSKARCVRAFRISKSVQAPSCLR